MIRHMTDHALIACRVTSETKARVRALATRQGITESTLVKRLLDVVLQTSGLDGGPTLTPPEKVNRHARLYVRLEPQDWRLLKERSKARGMASATYASLLLRSHLRGGAPLPKAEYVALMQSIEGLAAVGRSLNQIARALTQGERPGLPGPREVVAMVKVAEALRDHFRALLAANARSWQDGYARTSH
jgi:predicted DNA binding CopG/RHH family protein